MSRRDEHLDEVLCHCDGDDRRGHPLAAARCTAKVRPAAYGPGWTHYGLDPATPAATSAEIFTELARVTTDPQRRERYRASAAILRAADREWAAQRRMETSLYRERSALESLRLGTPGEKRKAKVSLEKAREALERARQAALELRRRNVA